MSILKMIKDGAGTVLKFGVAKSPTILAGLAITGVATIVGTALKSAPKYTEALEEHKNELEAAEQLHKSGASSDEEYKESRRKIHLAAAKKVALILLPTIIATAFTIGCIIGSHNISMRRQTALAAAYSLLDKDSDEYKKKVEELFGKKKADEVKEEIAKDYVEERMKTIDPSRIPGSGYLIMDKQSGAVFRSTIENIQRAANMVNSELCLNGMPGDVTWDQFYDFLEIPGLQLGKAAEKCGWLPGDKLVVSAVDSTYVAWTSEPVMVIDYKVRIGDQFRPTY